MENIESLMMSNFCRFKRLNEKKLEITSKKYDLRKIDMEIIVFLATNATKDTAKDIAGTERFTKGHISQSVKRLSEAGLLSSKQDDNDNRVQHLRLTEKAGEILNEMNKVKEEMETCIFSGITKQEMNTLRKIFDKMHDNVTKELN